MRWLLFIGLFLFVWIELSIFIQISKVLGIALTILLVFFTSCIGASLLINQGVQNIMSLRRKLSEGGDPAKEVVKSISLIVSGFLLFLPGFFTDILGLILFIPFVQKQFQTRLMPYLSGSTGDDRTIDGEYEIKEPKPVDQTPRDHNDR